MHRWIRSALAVVCLAFPTAALAQYTPPGKRGDTLLTAETVATGTPNSVTFVGAYEDPSTAYLTVTTSNEVNSASLVVTVSNVGAAGETLLCTFSAITTETTSTFALGSTSSASEGITESCPWPLGKTTKFTFTVSGATASFDIDASLDWVKIASGGGAGGGGGAPTDANYLVGSLNGSLSAEIAVGVPQADEVLIGTGAGTAAFTAQPAIDCTNCTNVPGGTPAFSDITAGTNTAALVVGASGSLGATSTGTITATGVDAVGEAAISIGSADVTTITIENEDAQIVLGDDVTSGIVGQVSGVFTNIDDLTDISGALGTTGTPSASTFLRGDNSWASPAGSGDVVGPAGVTADGNICRYDDTTGLLIQDSGCNIDDSGNLTCTGTISSGASATTGGSMTIAEDTDLGSSTWGFTLADTNLSGSVAIQPSADGTLDATEAAKLLGPASLTSTQVASATKTIQTESHCDVLYAPTAEVQDTDDIKSVWRAPVALAITEVWCETDTGTVTMDIQIDDGTPADVMGVDLVCAATAVSDSSGLTGSMADGDRLDWAITSVATNPKRLTVCFEYTRD